MPQTLTETHGNADFTTGMSVPANGDDSDVWSGLIVAAFQEAADRFQRLRLWVPDAPPIALPMVAIAGDATNFGIVQTSEKHYFGQTTLSATVGLHIGIPYLPVGRKITGVTAYWQNEGTVTLPIGTPPAVSLKKIIVTPGTAAPDDTTVGSQADTTAVLATYQACHAISLTGLTETIATDAEYYVRFSGEAGSNSVVGGKLWGLRVHLGV